MTATLGSYYVLYLQTQAFSKLGRYRFADEKFSAQRKELAQGHVANWWQGLEEKPAGLTHSSDTPAIISLLLLS